MVIEAARLLQDLLPAGVALAVAFVDGEEVEAAGPADPLLSALDQAGRATEVPLRARAIPSGNRLYAVPGLPVLGIGMGTPGYQSPSSLIGD
jgi:hypothetical protein